jgi:hypothetical protein
MSTFPTSPLSFYTPPTLLAIACFSLIAVGTGVTACDSAGSEDSGTETLIPLEEGNRWGAFEKGPDGERRGDVMVRVTSDGTALAQFGETTDTSTVVFREDENGIVVGFTLSGYRNMRLQYPVEDGDKYQYTDAAGQNTFEVSVSETNISVPAGNYDCIMYRIVQIRSEYQNVDRVCVKPGVGPVLWSREGVLGLNTVLELNTTNVEE